MKILLFVLLFFSGQTGTSGRAAVEDNLAGVSLLTFLKNKMKLIKVSIA